MDDLHDADVTKAYPIHVPLGLNPENEAAKAVCCHYCLPESSLLHGKHGIPHYFVEKYHPVLFQDMVTTQALPRGQCNDGNLIKVVVITLYGNFE